MSLKFKGKKGVSDFLPKTKKIKKASKQETEDSQDNEDPFSDKIDEKKTIAELSYDKIRKNRIGSRVQKRLDKNYKTKVENFNKLLSKLPMHFDIPKIGAG